MIIHILMGGDQEGGFKTARGGHGANIMQDGTCSLSLWRVARGSKHMFLELIHGLFIT